MHTHTEVLGILGRLVTVSCLWLGGAWHALGTTEAASETRHWRDEARRRGGCFWSFWTGRYDLGWQPWDLDPLGFVIVGSRYDLVLVSKSNVGRKESPYLYDLVSREG